MTRTALLLACLAGLSGCAEMGLVFVGANMATIIHADKTIPDFAISAQKKQNCSLLHAAKNEPYCQPLPEDPRRALADLAATRYCYRTLGTITCYDRPDYMASAETRVRFDNGFLPAPPNTAEPVRAPLAAPVATLPPLEPVPGLGPY